MNKRWFAVRVRPRTERVVADALRAKGYEGFLPLYRQRRRWSDRVMNVELPLFPGYVFSRLDVENRLPLLKTPGVLFVLGAGRVPEPVDDAEIESLQVLVNSPREMQPWPYLHLGEQVRILRGPFSGVTGMLVGVKHQRRLVVSISLLQRSVAVEITEDSVWPVSDLAPRLTMGEDGPGSRARRVRPVGDHLHRRTATRAH